MKAVHRRMSAGIEDGVFPGAVLLAAEGRNIRFHRAYGVTDIFSGAHVKTDTVFDLASLTKPLATAVAVMKLIGRGGVAFETPLKSVLTEFKQTDKRDISIAHLLLHTSGLPAYRPFYRKLHCLPADDRKLVLRRMLIAQPLADMPGRHTVYSDLGYMILEWVIERLAQKPLDIFLEETVYAPLAVERLFFPGDAYSMPQGSVAATEFCPWRNVLLAGRVHDDNAGAVGGIAGHAGLFGTAGGVFQLLYPMLSAYHGDSPCGVFRTDVVRLFFSPLGRTGRSPGFDRPEGQSSSAGRYFSENTVGHLGFTGTSFWMDVDRRVIVVLLTNRVHPSRNNMKIRAFRPRLHDAVMEMIFRDKDKGDEASPKIHL